MDRRRFLSATSLAAALRPNSLALAQSAGEGSYGRAADLVARDEDFWMNVRHAFTVDRNMINLNNGGVSPSPKIVIGHREAISRCREHDADLLHVAHSRSGNRNGSPTSCARVRMRSRGDRDHAQRQRGARDRAARHGPASRGDEVLTTNQDYPRMITTWQQRERRDGIVLQQITFPVPPPSLDYLASRIEENITPKTKVIHICHITNRTGQIFPVKQICQMARARGIEVIVDGAHAFGQFPFRQCRSRLRLLRNVASQVDPGADRHGNALRAEVEDSEDLADDAAPRIDEGQHSQVRGDRHASGLAAQRHHGSNELPRQHRRRTQGGTIPLSAQALVKSSSRAARGQDLEQRRSRAVLRHRLCQRRRHRCWKAFHSLWDKHRIWTTAIDTPGEYSGLRITPNVYTTLEEIDTFAEVMEKIIKAGKLPA